MIERQQHAHLVFKVIAAPEDESSALPKLALGVLKKLGFHGVCTMRREAYQLLLMESAEDMASLNNC